MKRKMLFYLLIIFCSCKHQKSDKFLSKGEPFKPENFELKNNSVNLVKGQVLYMPIYSNMPHYMDSARVDMSAFVAIHNTDFYQSVLLTNVKYYDTKGNLVHDYLIEKRKELKPLETAEFYVPYHDKSGVGANFLIEWKSDSLVTEPLIESITMNLLGPNSIAVLSQGKVIKEIK